MTHKPDRLTEEILRYVGWIEDRCGEFGPFDREVVVEAFTRQREEIVKSLRMERKWLMGSDLFDAKDKGYNQAIDEFNKKLDELLK